MNKLLIWLPGILSMLAACTEAVEIPARAPEKQSPVRVELHLTTEQQAATRAMDENCIRDVNLYLYGDTEYHFYFPSVSSPLVFNVLPGNYQSDAIANAVQDLGEMCIRDSRATVLGTAFCIRVRYGGRTVG